MVPIGAARLVTNDIMANMKNIAMIAAKFPFIPDPDATALSFIGIRIKCGLMVGISPAVDTVSCPVVAKLVINPFMANRTYDLFRLEFYGRDI